MKRFLLSIVALCVVSCASDVDKSKMGWWQSQDNGEYRAVSDEPVRAACGDATSTAVAPADAGDDQPAAKAQPDAQPKTTVKADAPNKVNGWLRWRGPTQDGVAGEKVAGAELLDHVAWTHDVSGRGTPVIASYEDGDRLFALGYRGEKKTLQEVLFCLNPDSGKVIWERAESDFLSDIIYSRYSIGAPTVDPQTGNVFALFSSGLLKAYDRDGKELWEVSLMETYGRLTFPNGRTGAPVVDGDRVIVNTISTNWGSEGPARNRFYAFHRETGELIWSSTPGVGPPFLRDSSFCTPYFENRAGYRVFYAGTGCGNVVAVNALSGEPMWRYQLALGGVNSSVIVSGDTLIAVNGKENVDDTLRGRMVGIDLTKAFEAYLAEKKKPDFQGPLVLDKSYEKWRNNEISQFTSSPTVYDDVVYQVTLSGLLYAVDVASGETLWKQKLGADQLHASPLVSNGRLYIPMWHDGLVIVEPTLTRAIIVDRVELDGDLIGSPALWNGMLYVHTLRKLYAFKMPVAEQADAYDYSVDLPQFTKPASLEIIPAEAALRPGASVDLDAYPVAANGARRNTPLDAGKVAWEKFIPPAAKVRSTMDADVTNGTLTASNGAKLSAGAFKATHEGMAGTMRGRVLPTAPFEQDFEGFDLSVDAGDYRFAFPPLPWIGARFKWEIVELNSNKVLAKTLDRVLFQRSMIFFGHEDESNYTLTADVMTDGNRRGMSSIGLINQRYAIALDGNWQAIEVHSNYDVINVTKDLVIKPSTWYTLKTRVDVNDDGSGVVRAKVWEKGKDEPKAWTIEVPVKYAHTNGSPGIYGFSPQSQRKVYVDNIKVTPND